MAINKTINRSSKSKAGMRNCIEYVLKSGKTDTSLTYIVVNGRFCPQSVRSFCPIVAGFNAGTYKVPACVL